MDRLLRMPEVAERTGFSQNTLRAWRQRGLGPRSARVGGSVVYRESDVEAWIDAQFRKSARGSVPA